MRLKENEQYSISPLQSVPLATSPKSLSGKYSFGLVKNNSDSIHFVIPTIPNHRNCIFGLVTQKVFGTDCH